ncbi:MAG: hypothetical protein SVW02_02265, partial [Candidatus Nanohaloarchaea archaeon]|nr:hypothetical protein [Candidatus Nanohaloarchaea archaeon]
MELPELLDDAGYELERQEADRHSRYRFDLLRDGEVVGEGTHFTGTANIPPWIELHLEEPVDPDSDAHRALFEAFSTALEPGSHCMVHYLGTDTAEA